MKLSLFPPENWQDFESLCLRLWRSIWNDPNTQKNGRTGQSQNGVDIFGKPYLADKYHGVQCKVKNSCNDSKLTKEEVDNESDKAASFIPELESFIIACTSSRDANIQEICREMNVNKVRPFSVDVWSWNDIEEEVQCRQELMEYFYPTHKQDNSLDKIILNRYVTQDRLAAFFTRPNIKENISQDFIDVLYQLLYELIDNSFKHGNATNCVLSISNGIVEFSDNGMFFNPLSLLDIEGNGGSCTFKYFRKKIGDKMSSSYSREEDLNILNLKINSEILSHSFTESIEITINGTKAFGKGSAEHEAIRIFSSIAQDKKHIILNITSDIAMAMSYAHAFFLKAVNMLTEGQDITVYVPNDLFYIRNITDIFKDMPIKFIQRAVL